MRSEGIRKEESRGSRGAGELGSVNRQPSSRNVAPASTVNRQPSTVNRQPSTVNQQLPTTNHHSNVSLPVETATTISLPAGNSLRAAGGGVGAVVVG
ncbi:hypothetical protein [Scytonema millei]|uniref:Uncharacterized protein n=1 Tax=Scytonema millei VB511283 TaxID=1245923 RepID=A0A9X5I975_9CYAN|nr:hypothetical protein [Scytonema millei]NHC38327.1 hypothetical protein [Scytonema millei VB511283]